MLVEMCLIVSAATGTLTNEYDLTADALLTPCRRNKRMAAFLEVTELINSALHESEPDFDRA
jgi:hypothetical protein